MYGQLNEFRQIIKLACLICESPVCSIIIEKEVLVWIGEQNSNSGKSNAFYVHDVSSDSRLKNSPFLALHHELKYLVGQAIVSTEGVVLGVLCLLYPRPMSLSNIQQQTLMLLASQSAEIIKAAAQVNRLEENAKFFDSSNDLVCVAGTDGFFRWINPSFQKILGWSMEIFKTKSVFDLVHPDDLEMTLIEVRKLSLGYDTINFVHRLRTSSGDFRNIQWTATPEAGSGNIFAIGRDLTSEKLHEQLLRSSEEKFRAFFQNSQGLMFTHDQNGKFLSMNPAGAAMLCYPVSDITSMSLHDIVPEGEQPKLDNYLSEIIRSGKAAGELVTQDANGGLKTWMYNNALINGSVLEGVYIIGNAIDITDRNNLGEELKHAQLLLEQTGKMARVGGWEIEMANKKMHWSDITRQIHGVSRDYEPVLETAINFYKEGDSRSKILGAINLAFTEGKPWDLELEIVDSRGAEIWVRAIGNSEFENGVCKKLFGTFQDIDTNKRAQLALDNSRRFIDNLLNAASEVSVIATDRHGVITIFNKGAEKLLGYEADEIIGLQTPAILYSPVEVKKRSEQLTQQYGQSIEGFRALVQKAEIEGSENRECTYIRKDGSACIVNLSVTAIYDAAETITGYLGIASDITEKKQIEYALLSEKARLTAFVEHAPAAIAMFDKDIRYLSISNKWMEDYRLERTSILGLSHYEVFPNIGQAWKDIHSRCLRGETISNKEEVWRPNGWEHDQYLNWEVRPWYLFGGDIGGIMMFTRDVTESVQQREELRHARVQSEHANASKSEFLANMSHEIRTPLNGVIGFTDLVLKTSLSETQYQYLSIVNQSANALLSIINDILDFSKIEAGKLELDIERCNLHEISTQSIDIITYQAHSKGLEMLLNIAPDVPRFVFSDSIRLKQILVNLMSNASKFTEKGEIELQIEMQGTSEQQADIRISVRDTGIGIQPDKLVKIFEAFSQEDSSTTKRYGGTGLGLTISNKLLGLMDSHLQLTSEPGRGSTFYFDLKLKCDYAEPVIWQNLDQIRTVLVVDDNVNNRKIIQQMMAQQNIDTVEAITGFEALHLLTTGAKFDAIFMDYHMPYMDGLETIRRIRDDIGFSSIPIILLHSSADDATLYKSSDALKVSHRLTKPVKVDDIFFALSHLSEKNMDDQKAAINNQPEGIHSKFTILLAEDNAVNMLLTRTIIRRLAPQSNIIEASNGLEALKFCQKQLPDLILMDVQMPEMNGYEASRHIRNLKTNKRIPIIALTAGNVKGEREKCFAAGMDDFVTKPVVEETLRTVLNSWLNFIDLTEQVEIIEDPAMENIHFSISKFKNYVGGDEEIFKEAVSLVGKELISSQIVLQRAYDENDLHALNSAGHHLYGSSAFGLTSLSKLAKSVELLVQIDQIQVVHLMEEIKKEIELILDLPIFLNKEHIKS